LNNENPAYPDADKTICIDFDGVIHNSYSGYKDGTCYGDMVPGADTALEAIASLYKVVVLTVKARPDRPLIGGKTGKVLVAEWLEKHKLMQYVSEITSLKPAAKYYIDDKGITFKQNWPEILYAVILERFNK